MFLRKIYKELEKSLKAKQIIALTGLRRVGKTTTIKYLYQKVKSTNKIFLDLEKIEYRSIFNATRYEDIIISLEIEGINFSTKGYIFLDEIQLINNIASVIKYIYDHYDIKFVVTGSSSFYMKGAFTESLAGRKRIFELFPLGFDEFLFFKGIKTKLPKFNYKKTSQYFISKYYVYYKEFIEFGGFPEIVLTKNKEEKTALLKDILNSYIKFDLLFMSNFTDIDEFYKIIKLLSSRVGSKVDYTKMSNIIGVNRQKIKEYILFLENSYFIRLIKPYVTNTDREIAKQKKLYFTDTGILNTFTNINTSAILENAVANQLSLLGNINFYAKKTGQEIDFVLNEKIAIEVKETATQGDLKTLIRRAKSINIEQVLLVALNAPGNNFENFTFGGAIY